MKIKSELDAKSWGEYDFIFSTEEECRKASRVLQAAGYKVSGDNENLRATINIEGRGYYKDYPEYIDTARKIIEAL